MLEESYSPTIDNVIDIIYSELEREIGLTKEQILAMTELELDKIQGIDSYNFNREEKSSYSSLPLPPIGEVEQKRKIFKEALKEYRENKAN